jgi:hypothetical protein
MARMATNELTGLFALEKKCLAFIQIHALDVMTSPSYCTALMGRSSVFVAES